MPFMVCFVRDDDGDDESDEDDKDESLSSLTLISTGLIAPRLAEQLEC